MKTVLLSGGFASGRGGRPAEQSKKIAKKLQKRLIIPARDPKQVRKILPGGNLLERYFWRGTQRGIFKRDPEEESRRGIPDRNPERNPEEESGSEIPDRNPAREESRRGIRKRNAGAESQIGIQRGIQERNPEEESRSGMPDRNPERNPEEESRRGIQKRNPGAESRRGTQRGIQGRNPGEESRGGIHRARGQGSAAAEAAPGNRRGGTEKSKKH